MQVCCPRCLGFRSCDLSLSKTSSSLMTEDSCDSPLQGYRLPSTRRKSELGGRNGRRQDHHMRALSADSGACDRRGGERGPSPTVDPSLEIGEAPAIAETRQALLGLAIQALARLALLPPDRQVEYCHPLASRGMRHVGHSPHDLAQRFRGQGLYNDRTRPGGVAGQGYLGNVG